MKNFAFLLMFFIGALTASQAQTNPLFLYRADGMKIKLTSKVTANNYDWYLYNEPDFWHSKNKAQSMWAVSTILGKGSAKNITDSNRSFDMKDDTGNYYTLTLPSLSEYYALRSASGGGRPSAWNAELHGGAEFWTSTYYWNDHRTVDVWNDHTFGRWDTDERVVAFRVKKWSDKESERKRLGNDASQCLTIATSSNTLNINYENADLTMSVQNNCKSNTVSFSVFYTPFNGPDDTWRVDGPLAPGAKSVTNHVSRVTLSSAGWID